VPVGIAKELLAIQSKPKSWHLTLGSAQQYSNTSAQQKIHGTTESNDNGNGNASMATSTMMATMKRMMTQMTTMTSSNSIILNMILEDGHPIQMQDKQGSPIQEKRLGIARRRHMRLTKRTMIM